MDLQIARILLLPGDGIGPEVVSAAVEVLKAATAGRDKIVQIESALVGGASIDACGVPITDEVMEQAKSADAVLLGAVGGPKWEGLDFSIRPERALLRLRKELGLYANLRPAPVFEALAGASTLKPEVVSGVDIMVVRELTGGIYFGEPRGVQTVGGKRVGSNTLVYNEDEVARIARVAFELAMKRRRKLTSIDKANVLESTELWRTVVTEVHADFPDVELNHMYVDNASMQLIRDPRQFDVIVAGNMFGDIISDEAAQLTGSIGMLASASVGDGSHGGMYEPVHGSAPDIAGKGIANPLATILSGAMMLEGFGWQHEAASIYSAVDAFLMTGYRCADIRGDAPDEMVLGTQAAAEQVCSVF